MEISSCGALLRPAGVSAGAPWCGAARRAFPAGGGRSAGCRAAPLPARLGRPVPQRRAAQLIPAALAASGAFAAGKKCPISALLKLHVLAQAGAGEGAPGSGVSCCVTLKKNQSPCNSSALSLGVIVKLFLQKPPKERFLMFGKTQCQQKEVEIGDFIWIKCRMIFL